MSVSTPDTAAQVEDRLKADVAREATDSNPYLRVHWLRSLLAGLARRIFDFYRDLRRTEQRLMPDTADSSTADRWGNIYVGPRNAATPASGVLVGTGTAGASVPISTVLTQDSSEYVVTAAGTVTANTLSVASITRSGSTATVTTNVDHELSSFIPVTMSGAVETEYNVTDAEITVTGPNTFEYQVSGSPSTPATGTIEADFTTVTVTVESSDYGDAANLDADTELALQSPIVNVDDAFYVTYDGLSGGTDEETTPAYKERYLDKIRNPVAHFNANDIIAAAKAVAGVTRVFVEEADSEIGTLSVSSLTRSGNVATVVTPDPHNFVDGARTTINGADQTGYNLENVAIIVEDSTTFHYVVTGTPVTPATGTIECSAVLALGQVRTYFMRDNDDDPIPSAGEVATVKAAIDAIRPANTSYDNNMVQAPVANAVAFTFTALSPNTATMQDAIEANLEQFFSEQTYVNEGVTEEQYKAAIQNTVDPDTGDVVETFTLSAPSGDVSGTSGEIPTLGTVTFP